MRRRLVLDAPAPRHPPPHQHQSDQPDGDVDAEDVAPAVLRAEQGDQGTADNRAGRAGDADGGAEVPEGEPAFSPGEELLDQPRALRGQQAGRNSLDQPGYDHQLRRGRESNRRAGENERDQADEHHDPPAVHVTQPTTRNQHQSERQGVPRDHPLDGLR